MRGDKKRTKYLSQRVATWSTAQHEKACAHILPVNKQIPSFWKLLTVPLFLVFGIWSISLSVPKTLSTFPYLSPRAYSGPPCLFCSTLGKGPKALWAASPASPPRCPLPLLSHRIRTRPSRTALSSEANTNQPQMFMLGGKGRQMQSHSIKLASLPLCPLCPSFPDFLHRSFITLRFVCKRGAQESAFNPWAERAFTPVASIPPLSAQWVTWVSPYWKKKEKKEGYFYFRLPDRHWQLDWSLLSLNPNISRELSFLNVFCVQSSRHSGDC